MKLYKYFRIADDDDADTAIREKYTLYAVTSDKTEAKLFERSRKEGIFLKKVTKVGKKTCIDYLNKHRDAMLSWNELRTVKFDDEHIRHIVVNVLMTDMEYDAVQLSEDSMSPVLDTTLVDPYIFNVNIHEALDIIGYIPAYILSSIEQEKRQSVEFGSVMEYLDGIEIDQLVLYLNMIKDQLNPKGFDSIIRFL